MATVDRMGRGRILFVSRVFSTSSPGRVEKFVRRFNFLAKRGWEVHVLTPREPGQDFRSHGKKLADAVSVYTSRLPSDSVRSMYHSAIQESDDSGAAADGEFIYSLFQSIFDAAIDRAASVAESIKPWVYLPDSWIDWLPSAIRDTTTLLDRHDFDVLFTSCYPFTSHLAGLRVTANRSIPWITEFRDPWVNNPIIRTPQFWKRVSRRLERRVVQRTDRLIIHEGWFPGGRTYFDDRYPSHAHKVDQLPYVGYDDRVFDAVNVDETYNEFTIVHAGNFHGEDCSPETFLRALATLDDRGYGDFRAVFLGEFTSAHRDFTEELGIDDRVEHPGIVPYEDVAKYLKRAHAGLWLMSEEQSYESNVPSKVFDYIGAEVPILALVPPGDCTEFVRANDAGVTAHPNDTEGVVKAISELYEAHQSGGFDTGVDPEEFSRSNALAAMDSMIESVHQSGETK